MSSTTITVFNHMGCRQYLLPAMENTDYELILYEQWFWLETDQIVHLECSGGQWYILPDESCRFFVVHSGRPLQNSMKYEVHDGELLHIVTVDEETLFALVQTKESMFVPSPRISLSSLHRLRFGTAENSEIRIPAGVYNAEMNLLLTREWHGFSAVPRNGLFYLNGMAINTETLLHYGDVIELPRYRLLFLGEELALLAGSKELIIGPKLYDARNPSDRAPEDRTHIPAVSLDMKPGKNDFSAAPAITFFHRAPRVLHEIHNDTIKIEPVPELGDEEDKSLWRSLLQSVLMVIPMMMASFLMIYASSSNGMGSSIMMYSGIVMALSTGMMGAVSAVLSTRDQKKRRKEKENRRFEAYSNYLIGKSDEIRDKYTHNIQSMLEAYPEPVKLLQKNSDISNLWNRNKYQDDFLQIRVGIGDTPFQVTIDVPEKHFSILEDELRDKPAFIKDNFKTLYDVPVLLNLLDNPLIGIVGGEEKKGAYDLMHVICAQLAVTHSYTDVRLAFFYDEKSPCELGMWDFAKWLPHSFSSNRKYRMTACNKSQISDISYELTSIFRKREGEQPESGNSDTKTVTTPHYILFLSDPALIQGELITRYIFNDAGKVGLTTIFLTDTVDNLPNECNYVLRNDDEFCGIVETLKTSGVQRKVAFDVVGTHQMEQIVSLISSLRVEETEENGEIPESVTFFEMYKIHRLEDFHSEELWKKNKIYENVRGLLGMKAGYAPMYMDVHEKMHGPHGLVAGTTGSGKSETLQTYLLSLAIEYSPDDIGFFIIDYKGGGMANLFNGLPHLLGSISNLSGAQIHRAMVAIKSENQRRQRMFNAASVNNINKYTMLYKNGDVEEPIPHLFIIIDEFAELKREEPDFMKELISVAQVGRSLGVHLILSTQRPAGTVDDNIASNAKFRLCLRVQTKEDSMDMLGKTDAAYITQSGRCYLQVGNDEVYELFQSGYSGAKYNPDEVDSANLSRLLTMTCRDDIVASGARSRSKAEDGDKPVEMTQLDAVKDYLAKVAQAGQYKEIHHLWLPLLKTSICLEELPLYKEQAFKDGKWSEISDEWELNTVIGMVDDPANQSQKPLLIDFAANGHHAVVGQVVTGKSTLLQTVVYSMVNRYTPEYINIYGLDFSSRMLSVFENLPHVGGIMYEGDEEKISRFFNLIKKTLEERKKIFRGGNYSQYYRANGLKYPSILILIDNYSGFNEKTGDKYLEDMILLSKEGESNGIYLLISGGGFSMTEIPNRLAANLKTCLCLEMKDKFSYIDYLHTMRFDVLPEPGVRGRGLCVLGGTVLEYQTALSLPARDDYERMQKIERKCEELRDAWTGTVAKKVPEIPANADWDGFIELEETQEAFKNPRLLPIGYREDNAEVYSLDLSSMFVYLITGTAQSGKTGFLNLMILSALQKQGTEIILFGEEKLIGLPEDSRLTVVQNADSLYELCSTKLTDQFVKRRESRKELETQDLSPEEIFDKMAEEYHMIFLFIEDLPNFLEMIHGDTRGISSFLENLARKGEGHLVYLLPCFSVEDRAKFAGYTLADALTGKGDGIHFGGFTGQNSFLNFNYISFVDQNKPEKKEIGLLPDKPDGDGVHRIVVPSMSKRKKKVSK